MKQFCLACTVLFLLVMISSCDKDSSLESLVSEDWKVENYNPIDWETELKSSASIRSKNRQSYYPNPEYSKMQELESYVHQSGKEGLLQDIQKKIGTPEWDYSFIINHSGSSAYTIFSPLIKNNKVNGVLEFFCSGGNGQKSIRAISYKAVRESVNGKTEWSLSLKNAAYHINTFRIAKGIKGYEKLNNWISKQGASHNDAKNYTTTTEIWIDTWCTPIQICTTTLEIETTYSCGTFDETLYEGGDGGGGGPSGGGGGNAPGEDPDEEDKIEVDSSATPCVKDMVNKIKDGQFGPNLFVQVLRDIFDVDDDVNITIEEEMLPLQSDGNFNATWFNNDVLYFQGIVQINSRYTSSGSEDWILATIIHEMIHGYFDYQKQRVNAGLITQAYFNSMFPLFENDSQNHFTMADNYVDKIKAILLANNPNLSAYEALSLSRIGLGDTGYWNLTMSEQAKEDAIRYNEIGRGTTVGLSNQKKCE